jgi:lipid A ethanolaminephosphotransferase
MIPSLRLLKLEILKRSLKEEMLAKAKMIFASLGVIAVLLFSFSPHYTSFFREHKALRTYTHPIYWIYNTVAYIGATDYSNIEVKPLGLDAKIKKNDSKKILIFIVGETARADHFSLNGYQRETNPLLKKEKIMNFSNVTSCGTSTAHSVPCMFSIFKKDDYSYKKGVSNENLLDVLTHTGDVAVLWRDNNSNSKGVAVRVEYKDYKGSSLNTICENGECRDEGMLVGLNKFIEAHPNKNIMIVLHQMGNHGPAYYKRYPKEFEQFTPVCKTNQIEECSKEEVVNAYDNALLYTDYFLSKSIEFLKQYDKEYETAMMYMSDHGESLGEGGVYLHGLPYFIAPQSQTHIPALLWLGEKSRKNIDTNMLKKREEKSYSHDNIFSTVLGFFGVQSEVYEREMDIFEK